MKSRTRLYNIWQMMRQRCNNPRAKGYEDYGGRGITVCERWQQSFDNFVTDMGEPPTKGHTLDRRENDKGYSPDNCRWATKLEQQQNMRTNRFVEYRGERRTVADWSRVVDVPEGALWNRLFFLKWTIERAMTTPVVKKPRKPRPRLTDDLLLDHAPVVPPPAAVPADLMREEPRT